MTLTRIILALACLMPLTLVSQQAKVTQLMSKDLTNIPGKEGLMVTVEYPPGSKDPIDRKSTRLNSSHMSISYAVFCLKKKKKKKKYKKKIHEKKIKKR